MSILRVRASGGTEMLDRGGKEISEFCDAYFGGCDNCEGTCVPVVMHSVLGLEKLSLGAFVQYNPETNFTASAILKSPVGGDVLFFDDGDKTANLRTLQKFIDDSFNSEVEEE